MTDPQELIRASDGTYDATLYEIAVDPWAEPTPTPDWSHIADRETAHNSIICRGNKCHPNDGVYSESDGGTGRVIE